ncbi:hypothetical protein B0O99DRAFT_689484 [Bisporella sp. PMI_857]|nr:hypothetical protein B0O99DRAFT_689484 [Bisporella sp. PMI_857]
MHLLEYNDDGEIHLATFIGDDIPRNYAILSHTWGTDEVTYTDIKDGTGKNKAGYTKIQFCGEQAKRDSLRYFWVDTCCIDKRNSTELAEAVNSMFRWYRAATKCYVYLLDVSWPYSNTSILSAEPFWHTFRESRWFTRGWTLQELIAPGSVDFFSREGKLLGNKTSLEKDICEATGIPAKALQGSSLSEFSVTERISWTERRQTAIAEDRAYSLLGIFDVNMPLIYGEGREKATKRLREEIDKAMKGTRREDFSITFSLSGAPDIYHFVAREKELAEMHKELQGDGSRRIVTLHGLGGIGKTQLSIKYAKQHKDNYSAIFWFNIKDKDSLKQTLIKVAKQIIRNYPAASFPSSIDTKANFDEVVDAVKAWLSLPNNTRWLLIFDNYDNPKMAGNKDPSAIDIRKFFPESYQGAIIITTRSSQVKLGHCIKVSKLLDMHDSLKILSNASDRKGLIHGEQSYIQKLNLTTLDIDARLLAKELDGLPLALATAGAYLNQVTIGISEYLRLYKASWVKLQQMTPELDSYEDRTLYSTWQISFYRLEQQNRLSAELLRFWAYFNNQDIWLELLQHNSSSDPKWLQDLTKDELSFHGAMRVLSNYGLVEEHVSSQQLVESRGYSIHGCVHAWTIHVLNQEWDYDLARLAIECVGSHVPNRQDFQPWVLQRRLLQHAAKCSYMVLNCMTKGAGMDWAYYNLGNLYADQDKLEAAEQMYQRALVEREKALGPDHTLTLDTVNNLGNLYTDQGEFKAAEQMYQRALAGRKKALGPDHISTLNTVNNLGILYSKQNKFKEAEQMYQQALTGQEKTLGPDHMSTLDTINNLGNFYADQSRFDKAKHMYQRTLAGREKALGPGHILTLETINNLGNLYVDQNKLEKAEQMYQRALAGNEKALGPDHTSTLDTVNNLGNLYVDQNKLEKAEQMYQRALAGKEKALGPDHISTLDTVNNLGSLYKSQNKLKAAEQMYQRALAGREKSLGPDHTSTLNTVYNLGILYANQDKLDEAEQMYQRALAGREKALGPDHISTLNAVINLGVLYAEQNKLEEAEQMYQRALARGEKALGLDHTLTLSTVYNFGILYAKQNKLEKAEQMYQRALAGKTKALGPDHISTLNTVYNLGILYANQNKLSKAEQMYQRALAGNEKALGPDHTLTLDTVNNLGILYVDQNKLEKAEQMYQRALAGKEKALGPDQISTLDTVNNLGILYAKQNKLEKAEQMYQRALAGREKALGPDHISTLDTVNNLGILYAEQNKLKEAEQMYQRALAGIEKALGPDHTSTLNTVYNLGLLYSKELDKLDKAKDMYQRALKGYAKAVGSEHKWTFDAVEALSNLHQA